MSECILECQQQPTWNTCASASIATILGIDVRKVVEEFHDDYYEQRTTITDYLSSLNVPHELCLTETSVLDGDCCYILTVPSLNLEGVTHFVCVQVDASGGWYLFDPNEGRDGVKWYNLDPESDGVLLKGWSPSVKFKISDILKWSENK